MTTIFRDTDGNMYSLKEGWTSEEDYWAVKYGFAPEPLPGLSIVRSLQHRDIRRLPGNVFNTLLTVGGASVITHMLSQQFARTTGSLAFEALFSMTPVQAAGNISIVVAPGVFAVGASTAYVHTMKRFEPRGSQSDKSSFWNSIAAAMAGTFGGMPHAGDY